MLLRTAAFVVVVGLVLMSLGRLGRLSRRALIGTLWMAMTLAMVSLGYQGSVAFIPVSLAALIFYSFPLLVGLFAVIAGRDRMTAGKAAALLAAFLGLALALGPEFGALDWRGIALALLAAVGMSLTMTFGGEATTAVAPRRPHNSERVLHPISRPGFRWLSAMWSILNTPSFCRSVG